MGRLRIDDAYLGTRLLYCSEQMAGPSRQGGEPGPRAPGSFQTGRADDLDMAFDVPGEIVAIGEVFHGNAG